MQVQGDVIHQVYPAEYAEAAPVYPGQQAPRS